MTSWDSEVRSVQRTLWILYQEGSRVQVAFAVKHSLVVHLGEPGLEHERLMVNMSSTRTRTQAMRRKVRLQRQGSMISAGA